MPPEDGSTILSVLGRRENVLRCIDSDGCRKRDLLDELSVSRSTVDRAVRELVDAELVRRSDDCYHRATAGELVLEEYDRAADRIAGLVGASSFLDGLPAEGDTDPVLFDGATVVEADHLSPATPIDSFTDLVERSSYVVGFLSAIFPAQVETYRRQLLDGDLTARMVVSDSVCRRLVSRYGDAVRDGFRTGRIDVRRATELPSYTLVVGTAANRAEVGLVAHTANGIRGVLRNDDPDAVEWARRRIAARWRESAPVCPPGLDDD